MADDKGSDLDVFEGLTKKKSGPASLPTGPSTVRGGVGGAPLPPPKRPSGNAIPIPKPPPSKAPGGGSGIPAPKPPPSRRDSDSPAISAGPVSSGGGMAEDVSSSANVLPGSAVADLDWDDDEEATSVFDRSASDLFGELSGKPRHFESAEAPTSKKPDVSKAAALLASSGRSAKAIRSTPPGDDMPQIPAPAPVPREIADSRTDAGDVSARPPHPSWAPADAPSAPAKKGGGSTMLLAAVAVLVLGAAAFFYLRRSSDAMVMINVTHEGDAVEQANIYVDGQRKCEFAPCKLELSPGSKTIRVVSGDLSGTKTIQVEGGEDQDISVSLEGDEGKTPDAAGSASSKAEEGPASLTLTSKMKDAEITVFVNGEEKGKIGDEPLKLEDIEPGKVTLRFEGGDKYGKVEKTVKLEPGQTLEIEDVELPLLEIEVTFKLETKGADVELVKEDDKGKEEKVELSFKGNEATEKLDTSYKYTLTASLKGYEGFEKVLDFDGADKEMDVAIELVKAADDKPKPVAATTTPAPTPKPTTPDKPEPKPAAADYGFINANSLPPAGVIIDGRPHGTAPVTGVRVSPGSHTVVFRHKEYGTKSRTVTVAAGQTATAAVRFDPGGGKKKKKKK